MYFYVYTTKHIDLNLSTHLKKNKYKFIRSIFFKFFFSLFSHCYANFWFRKKQKKNKKKSQIVRKQKENY